VNLFESDIYPFFDNEVEFMDKEEVWYNSIDENYAAELRISTDLFEKKDSEIALCTIVDMGDMGGFSRECTHELIQYAQSHSLNSAGNIRGILCSRGMENGSYQRFLELQMPVKV